MSSLHGRAVSGVLAAGFALALGGTSRAQVTDLPQSWTFDADEGGWTYVDDAFRGTSDPAQESGSYDSASYAGGGLKVEIGHCDGNPTMATSGGWKMDLTLTADAPVAITFRYNLTMPLGFEPWEYAEVLLEVDGTLHGSGGNDYIDRMTGMTGAGAGTTDWQQFTTTVALTAAASPHTVTIGCYNNESTGGDEIAVLQIDEVSLVDASGASGPVPAIVGIAADDPDDGDMVLSADDTLTIRFDVDTNEPAASNKAEIDGLLNFGTKSLGTGYTGAWSDAKTLVITVVDASGGTLASGDTVTVTQDGTDDLANAWDNTKISTASGTVAGDWGFNPDTDPSLICWWKLDDGSATTAVDSGLLGLDGTVSGATPVTDTDRGPVYSFDGTDDYVAAADPNNDLLPIVQVTIACWVKPAAIGTSQTILSKRDEDTSCTFAVELETDGTVSFNGGGIFTSTTTLTADTWTHVLFSKDVTAGSCKVYIDGQLDADLSGAQRSPFGDQVPARIGCYSTDGTALTGWFQGSVSDVRIYEVPLNDTQAQRVYAETVAAAVTVSIAPGADAAEPSTNGSFDLTIEGAHAGFTLDFTVSGSATAGTDYTDVGTSLVIPSGDTTAAITIALLPDTDLEGPEDVTITLVDGTDYMVGSPGAATIQIADDDSFNLLTPASGTQDLNAGADQDFTWEDASGKVTGLTGYTLEIAVDMDFTSIAHTEALGVVTTATVAAGTLSYSETYWWRVLATDGTNSYECNKAFTFGTATFSLLTPSDGNTTDVNPDQATDFTWESVPGALGYTIKISETDQFAAGDIVIERDVDAATSTYSLPSRSSLPARQRLDYRTDYWWRVSVSLAGGLEDCAQDFTFTTTGDTTPPYVVSPQGLSGHDPGQSIAIVFSEPLDTSSVTVAGRVTLVGSGGSIEIGGTIEFANGDRTVIFNPTSELDPDASYTLTISSEITDANGVPLGADYTLTFTTATALVGLAVGEGCVPAAPASAAWVVLALSALAVRRRRP